MINGSELNYGGRGISYTKDLLPILRQNPQIKTIHLSNNKIDDDGLALLYPALADSHVEQIFLNNNRITGKSFLLLSKIKSLVLLSVNGNDIEASGYSNLPSSNIQILYLRRCGLSSETIRLLSNCPNLRELYLGQNSLFLEDLRLLLSHKHLTKLELCEVAWGSRENLLLALSELSKSSLFALDISRNEIRDEGLEILLRNSNLRALDVNYNQLSVFGISKILSISNQLTSFTYHYNAQISVTLSSRITSQLRMNEVRNSNKLEPPSTEKYCVLIDTGASSRSYSKILQELGYSCIYIQSTETTAIYRVPRPGTYSAEDYAISLEHNDYEGDLGKLFQILAPFTPIVSVIPGTEFCVELADALMSQNTRGSFDKKDARPRVKVDLNTHSFTGEIYTVNTVSCAGEHRVTHICKHSKTKILSNSVILLPMEGDIQQMLVGYSLNVLNNIGVKQGPTHISLTLVNNEPVLLDLAQSIDKYFDIDMHSECLEMNQVRLSVYAHLRQDLFRIENSKKHHFRKYFIRIQLSAEAHAIMINQGTSHRFTEFVAQLSSARNVGVCSDKDTISMTATAPVPYELWLANANYQVLQEDYQRIINRLPDGSVTSSNTRESIYFADDIGESAALSQQDTALEYRQKASVYI